ncbi:MAG: hypothetical protein BWY63_03019 [Chloroflexi bacterium ADurb.Bin360]|nr:MAG: hypothetical protein BWY63_03019 [Chloroflexi bacterium ADurb.Bin360]
MAIYVVLAYSVFCAVPFGLALSILARRRRVQRQLAALHEEH